MDIFRKYFPFYHSRTGFTLFEIMLAIFIFGIVITTLFGSYRAVFSSTESLDTQIESFEMAGNCLTRIITDIQSAYIELLPGYSKPEFDSPPDPYRVVGDSTKTGQGKFARLRFTSKAHIPLGGDMRKGIAEIVYYVYETEDGHNVLKRSDHLWPYPKFQESVKDPVLCEQVKSFTIFYTDYEGNETEEWDSESGELKYATPKAIRVKLEIGDEENSLVLQTMAEFPLFREPLK